MSTVNMNNVIYLSGPITDPVTSQPREGWQEAFREAETRLMEMGFEVINPVDLSVDAKIDWLGLGLSGNAVSLGAPDGSRSWPKETPRWFYLHRCLRTMSQHILWGRGMPTDTFRRRLAGVYVIGDLLDIQRSYGVMCEINFALAAGLPVWCRYFHGYQVDNLLRQDAAKATITEYAKHLAKNINV